jgi:hypothetical protein
MKNVFFYNKVQVLNFDASCKKHFGMDEPFFPFGIDLMGWMK